MMYGGSYSKVCGCVITVYLDAYNEGPVKIKYCPTHAAALELLEALIMLTESSGLVGWIKARAAIARAAPD
jgi:hypothetical protein